MKIKAEAFDIMQFFYGKAHDPLIHCYVEFSEHINEKLLKKAVTISMDAVPQIGCCFDNKSKNPYWKKQDFTGEDIVKVVNCDSNREEWMNYLSSTIDFMNEPQLKIFLLRYHKSDSMCIIISHMICDGAGFKEYLYLLAKLYTELYCDNNKKIELMAYSRSTKLLFKQFNFREKISIIMSKYSIPKEKQQLKLLFEGDENNPLFITYKITEENFKVMKEFSKKKNVTINDIIIAAYARLLNRKTGIEQVIIPCPVNLRKYLVKNQKHGICNLTSNYICDIRVEKNCSFYDILSQVSQQMKIQKENNNCLKSIIMLETVFKIVPFNILEKNFHKVFTIPFTSFTNLGVIDEKQMCFGNIDIKDVYITGAIKHTPYFQIAISTYNNICTLSCNLYGTSNDKLLITNYLEEMIEDVMNNIIV